MSIDLSTAGESVGYLLWDTAGKQLDAKLASNSSWNLIHSALSNATSFEIRSGWEQETVYCNYRNIEDISLRSGALADLLIVQGIGNYNGNSGFDTLYADWSGTTNNIVFKNVPSQSQKIKGNVIVGIERLLVTTGRGNDIIDNSAAGAANDYIATNAGDDTVNAGDGNDWIDIGGGTGSESVNGGMGKDHLAVNFISNGGSYYQFNPGSGASNYLYANDSFGAIKTVLAEAWASVTLAGDDGHTLTYRNIEGLDLQTGVDSSLLIYQHGGLYNGGGGTDTFYAGWSKTTAAIVWVNAPTQTQTVNGVTVSGLERLLLTTGSGNDILDNSALTATDDYLVSGAGDDTVRTGKGDDTVNAGAGNDFINTGSGNDTVYAGGDNDQIQLNEGMADGGAGNDRLAADFSSNGGPPTISTPAADHPPTCTSTPVLRPSRRRWRGLGLAL